MKILFLNWINPPEPLTIIATRVRIRGEIELRNLVAVKLTYIDAFVKIMKNSMDMSSHNEKSSIFDLVLSFKSGEIDIDLCVNCMHA